MSELRAFDSWYEKSGVRATERRMQSDDEDILKDFFPRHLIAHLNHPLVTGQAESMKRYLIAQHLYQWLNFTSQFEIEVVCRATQRIADNSCGVEVGRSMRLDAFRILVDENYHALYSFDAVDQIEKRSGIPALDYEFQPYLRHLDSIGDDHPRHRPLVQLLQVVVFETLITALLNDVPKDRNVMTMVRDIVRDHAIDEGRHHAYFAEFFKQLWGQLSPDDRRIVALLLPEVVLRSLQPSTRSARAALEQVGFSAESVRSIIAESYGRDCVVAGIRYASERTIGLFESCGVLDAPEAREGFVSAGLLLP
jgi:hypothetical protein